MKRFVHSFLCICFFVGIWLPIRALGIDPRAEEVLDYWFGPLHSEQSYSKDKIQLWFGKSPKIDEEIRDRFEDLIMEASNNHLDHWKKSPRGYVALLIVMDQFTRNVYRETPQAFCLDYAAQKLTLEGLTSNIDLLLHPIERVFFYLPLEHAEDLDLQVLSVCKFNELAREAPIQLTQDMNKFAEYAMRHYEIIASFGRFPHRNQILERQSTPEEVAFLKEENSSF